MNRYFQPAAAGYHEHHFCFWSPIQQRAIDWGRRADVHWCWKTADGRAAAQAAGATLTSAPTCTTSTSATSTCTTSTTFTCTHSTSGGSCAKARHHNGSTELLTGNSGGQTERLGLRHGFFVCYIFLRGC